MNPTNEQELREQINAIREELVGRNQTHQKVAKRTSYRNVILEITDELITAHITAVLDRVAAEIPDEKVGTEKIPLNDIERGYNLAVQDCNTALSQIRKELL